VLTVVLHVTATFTGVFREVGTKYLKPASFPIPEPLWVYPRDQDILERAIPEKRGEIP
jgi:hypothetical protein